MSAAGIDQLERDPQLAILAVLEFALKTAADALFAAHHDLCNQVLVQRPPSPTTELAEAIVHQAYSLRTGLTRYREALDDMHRTAIGDLSDDNLF